ncbi:MAG: TonB-dependent receptor [Pseudomonadota bacterium]
MDMVKNGYLRLTALFLSIIPALPGSVFADTTVTSKPQEIEVITVYAERQSLTNDPTELSKSRLFEVAGAVNVLGPEDRFSAINRSLADAIGGTPGVIVQNFFGGNDQPRLQIRGSGLQQNPTQRGILLLQDGLPLSRADGSYIVASMEPNASNTIEIYRGATANNMGAATLGGAVNFISLTGRDAQSTNISITTGSFDTLNGQLSTGFRSGKMDARATVVSSRSNGYREPFNDSHRTTGLVNVGYRLSDSLETRVFLDYTKLSFDVVGPITQAALNTNPESVHTGPVVTPNPGGMPPFIIAQPGPNVPRDLPRRDAEKIRLSSKTTYLQELHELDIGFTYAYTDEAFRFPVSAGVRDTSGDDIAIDARYTLHRDASFTLPILELSAHYITGEHERKVNHNAFGVSGALFALNDLSADTLSLNASTTFEFGDHWRVNVGLNYIHASRENTDTFAQPTRPTLRVGGPPPGMLPPSVPAIDTGFDRSYQQFNPSIRLSYSFAPQYLVFMSIADSFEPPTFEDLLTPIGGTPNSGPTSFRTEDLKAQSARTLELGARGSSNDFSWDLVFYQSWLDDELLSLRDATGVPLGTRNADSTERTGFELGLSYRLSDWIDSSISYTYQAFTFDNDPFFGNNDLAGTQPHTVDAKVRFALNNDLDVIPTLSWLADDTPVDNANTLFRDSYALLGLQAHYRLSDYGMGVMLEIRNITDKTYASSSLVTDIANPSQAAFLPGDGRSFYIGVDLAF